MLHGATAGGHAVRGEGARAGTHRRPGQDQRRQVSAHGPVPDQEVHRGVQLQHRSAVPPVRPGRRRPRRRRDLRRVRRDEGLHDAVGGLAAGGGRRGGGVLHHGQGVVPVRPAGAGPPQRRPRPPHHPHGQQGRPGTSQDGGALRGPRAGGRRGRLLLRGVRGRGQRRPLPGVRAAGGRVPRPALHQQQQQQQRPRRQGGLPHPQVLRHQDAGHADRRGQGLLAAAVAALGDGGRLRPGDRHRVPEVGPVPHRRPQAAPQDLRVGVPLTRSPRRGSRQPLRAGRPTADRAGVGQARCV